MVEQINSLLAGIDQLEAAARAYGISETTIDNLTDGTSHAPSVGKDGYAVANVEQYLLAIADAHAKECGDPWVPRQGQLCLLCVYIRLGLEASIASMRKRLSWQLEQLLDPEIEN